MKLKIGVFFDSDKDGGGGYYQSLSVSNSLNKIKDERFKFVFICTDKKNFEKLNTLGFQTEFFPKKNLSRKYHAVNNSPVIKFLLKTLKIKNPFNNFLVEKKYDIIIFLGPSYFIQLCESINFITTIYDINHILENYFPEYNSYDAHIEKNNIIKKSVEKAYKIFVDTHRTKNEIIKFYNCKEDKLIVQSFTPYLPILYENKFKNSNFQNKISNLGLNTNDKFIFYPAQFWAHKNHKYILDSIKILKKKNLNIKVIFSGVDKGNLNHIKNLINKYEINSNVKIFPFLNEEEIVSLYKHCAAVVMPTYVARSTLPLYESFYFKKTIFYSKGVLDEKIEKLVIPFDLENPNDLSNKFIEFFNNKQNDELLIKAKEYYEQNCKESNLITNYKNVLEKYLKLSSIWKI